MPKSEGYIYLIHASSTNRYKIGLTTRNVQERLNELNSSQSAYPLKLVASAKFQNVHVAEKELHAKYSRNRVHGEWFEFTNREAQAVAANLSGENKPLIFMWQIVAAFLIAIAIATCQISQEFSNQSSPQQIKNR